MIDNQSRIARIVGTLVAVLTASLVATSFAYANLTFDNAGFEFRDATNAQARQAGSHPDFTVSFSFPKVTYRREQETFTGPSESAKDITVDFPPGIYANAQAFSTCSQEQFVNNGLIFTACPTSSQIGVATFSTVGNFGGPAQKFPVYNVEHGPDKPALFGIKYLLAQIQLTPHVRASDYGISTVSVNTTQAQAVQSASITLWGVPADPRHDTERVGSFTEEIRETQEPVAATSERVPFFTISGACESQDQRFGISVNSWEHPDQFDRRDLATDPEGAPFVWSGCENQPFASSLAVRPESRRAGSPTGLDVDLSVTPSEGPDGLSAANVKRTVVEFPPGMTLSASAAAGRDGCSESDVGLGNNNSPNCSINAKIGTVSVKTQLLPEPLEGEVVLAAQKANPFGSNFAVYVLARGPGFWLKIPGVLRVDDQTGSVVAVFDEMPQLPFESVTLHLEGGSRAPLRLPPSCGNYSIKTEISSWARPSKPQVSIQSVRVDEGCTGGGFEPRLKAGAANPGAGSFSPFNLVVTQGEREANLSDLQATLPPGLLASLRGVPLCGAREAETATCSPASQVGTVTIGVGAGSDLLYLPQAGKTPTGVYLGGPYRGAPYSLVVKVPAQAGPFDLGTVTVRNALEIDPFTTQVTAKSDRLPQIIEGVPVTYRDLRVELDRPGFTINPTNCSQFAVTSVLTSADGKVSAPQAPFAVTGCERLAFKPKLSVTVQGATRRAGHPALKAVLAYPQKGTFANIAGAQVSLPRSAFLDQGNLDETCVRPRLLSSSCPPSTVYGKARAWSPLLDEPLEGPVYLVGGFGYKLPALVADLNGQIRVILKARIDTGPTKGLRATFAGVPDAPVSRFVLELKGGKKYGLLVNSEDLCNGPQKFQASFIGQNGAVADLRKRVAVKCGKVPGQN